MPQVNKRSSKAYTYSDYLTWPEDQRWEIIDGEPFDMTPAPSVLHQEILVALAEQILDFLKGWPCKMYLAPCDVLLPESGTTEKKSRNVVQPDILVLCDPARRRDAYLVGAPDFVIEILSPSTAGKDQIRKRSLYERHGVKEFWLVHPTDRTVRVYRLQGSSFSRSEMFEGSEKVPVLALPGLEIDLSRVFPAEPKVVREPPTTYRAKKSRKPHLAREPGLS
jgi:Uma2 family endonuclease